MNKQEFLNTLRIIFKKANVLDVKSIIDVYEEHFAVGYEKGLNDEQIIKSLGTPKEIYTSYVEAGIITDEIGREGTKRTVNMQAIYARLEEYKALLLPQLPGVAKKASHTLLTVASALTYIVGVLLFIVTPAILFLFSAFTGSTCRSFRIVMTFSLKDERFLVSISCMIFRISD